jgi:D-alanine-D-alanine ligase-like ATP-grasp enzyme
MTPSDQLARHLRERVDRPAARLIEAGITVVITYGGGPANQYGLASSGTAIVEELTARGVSAMQIPVDTDQDLYQLAALDPARVVVWITDPYRSRTGPDGRAARSDLRDELRAVGLPVVCQSAGCSTATLYKDVTAVEALAAGLRPIPAVRVDRGPSDADVEPAVRLLGAARRVVVKPVDGDEGLGVTLVESVPQLFDALAVIHDGDSDALVEPYTPGVEVGVPVLMLGTGEIVALPAVEASTTAGVLIDHRVKTTPGALRLFCPPRNLTAHTLTGLAEQAVALAARLDGRTLLRVDFIVDGDVIWFLEANSFPGLSPTGLAMASLGSLGLSRGDLALLVISESGPS